MVVMVGLGSQVEQKTARLSAGGFFGILFGGLSLAGPFRQMAGEIKEKAEEPARHGFGFCHKTICVQRNSAILPPPASLVTTASHTWVVRPRCTGVARHRIAPSRAVPRKLDVSWMGVDPIAHSGSCVTRP